MSPTTYLFESRIKDTKSKYGYGTGPRFRVVRTQDSSSAIVYSSGWYTSTAGSPSGGGAHVATTSGKTATFTYTGRAFAIVGTKGSNRGNFNVYVDGVKVTSSSVKTKASSTQYRRVLYWRQLPQGTHTVRIVTTGSKRVDLDAFLTIAKP